MEIEKSIFLHDFDFDLNRFSGNIGELYIDVFRLCLKQAPVDRLMTAYRSQARSVLNGMNVMKQTNIQLEKQLVQYIYLTPVKSTVSQVR